MKDRALTRVVIYKDDKVLLSRTEGLDFWYPGGGTLEKDEDLKECAKREVKEETGMVVEILDLMYVLEFTHHSKSERNLEFFFLAKPIDESSYSQNHRDEDIDGERTPIGETRWFSRDDFESGEYKVYPEFFAKNFYSDIKGENKNIQRYFKEDEEK